MRTVTAPVDNTVSGQRRDEIRQVAADLFESRGYSATTMTDIAEAVGIRPGSLYHHFASKEEIAVEILGLLDEGLTALATSAAKRLSTLENDPEERVRRLATEVTGLSLRSGAALRLYAYDAPSVATERFREALRFKAPSLEKAWKQAFAGMTTRAGAEPDTTLIRFAFHRLTLGATLNTPHETDAGRLAGQISGLLLDGLLPTCPDAAELDSSEAMAAARTAVASWPPPVEPTGSGTREDIIAAARVEFARRGYSATTIRDVAEAAGVRMGTLYRRIDSKDEILGEILEGYSTGLERGVRTVLTTGSSVAESVDALAYVFVHAQRRYREELDVVKFGWRGREKENDPFHTYFQSTQERLQLLDDVLSRGIAEGTVRPIGPTIELGVQIRSVLWLPFQDIRVSTARTHQFLRSTLLRGYLNP